MKYALVLQGGGLKGAYYVGAMKALLESGIEPDMVCGTSTGALFGALIAMRKYGLMTELCNQVGETNGANIFTGDILELHEGGVRLNTEVLMQKLVGKMTLLDKAKLALKKYQDKLKENAIAKALKITGLMTNDPLRDLLLKHVKEEDFKADFWLTLVSQRTGKLHTLCHTAFKTNRDLALAVLASSNIPGLLKPIDKIYLKDGSVIEMAVDGGLRMSSPVALAYLNIHTSFEWEVISLELSSLVQPLNSQEMNAFASVAISIDILLNDGFAKDVKKSKEINQWVLEDPAFGVRNNFAYAHLHNIEVPVDKDGVNLLGSVLDPRPEWITKRVYIGYNTVKNYLTCHIQTA